MRVYATALLLAESLNRATAHTGMAPPTAISDYCRRLTHACLDLANQPTVVALKADDPLATMDDCPAPPEPEPVLQPEWLLVHENARQLERALRALIGSRDA